ncbi:MAG: hypothetical protein R2861_04770 [Desulfobacterales bacterium]
MGMVLIDLQPLEQPVQLPVINLENISFCLRPPERLFLQTLVPQAKPVSIPVQNFYDIFTPVTEYK